MSFTIATTLDDALAAVGAGARPIAGGTDLVVGARQGKQPLPASLVAIDRIDALSQVTAEANEIHIGAGVTHAQLLADDLVTLHVTAIADAAALVGSPATRNVGTIGGNVMNGSPAMDTGAPLIVLGGQAQLQTQHGSRLVPLDQLWTAPGQTSAEANELCTALVVPRPTAETGSAYVRLEYRRAMEIAVVGAAAAVTLDDAGAIAKVRVALTAVAPTIIEVAGLDRFEGAPANDATFEEIGQLAAEQATPISDLRATDAYRRHTIGVMAKRSASAAARRAAGEYISIPVNRALGIGAAL